MIQGERRSLSELSTLSLADRLRELSRLSTQFANLEATHEVTEQQKSAFAEAFIVVQRGIIEASASGKLTDQLRQLSETLIFKTIDQLAENNIRIPIPESVQMIQSGKPHEQIAALETAKKTVDQATKHNQELTALEKDSVVGIIVSFQHFLCRAYKVKDKIKPDDWNLIQDGITVFKLFIPELIKAGIQIPLSGNIEGQPHAEPAPAPAKKDTIQPEAIGELTSETPQKNLKKEIKQFASKQLESLEKFAREQYEKAVAELSQIAGEISTYLKDQLGMEQEEEISFKTVVAKGVERWQKHQEEKRRKKREEQEQKLKAIRLKRRTENEQKKKTLKPGDTLLTFDELNKPLTREVIVKVSRKNLTSRVQYLQRKQQNQPAERDRSARWFNANIENIEIVQARSEIIGADNSIGLSESTRAYETDIGITAAAACDKGVNSKDHNEDRVVAVPDAGFFAVIDGVGGQGSGDRAAEILAEHLKNNQNVSEAVGLASQQMAQEVANAKDEQEERKKKKSSAAFVSAKLHRVGRKTELEYHYAGDCSLIVLHADGTISVGKSDSHAALFMIPDDEALYYARRNVIMNAVGYETPEINSDRIRVSKGDRVILASDGISDNLTPEEIRSLIRGLSPKDAIKKLDKITSTRMENWWVHNPQYNDDNVAQNPDALSHRQRTGKFQDGYRSAAKADNRGIVIFDITE